MNKQILLFLTIALLCSCKQEKHSQISHAKEKQEQNHIGEIKLPSIPAMMTTEEQKNNFLANHYWDSVNFKESDFLGDSNSVKQAWVNYIYILNQIKLSVAQKYIKSFILKTTENKKTFKRFTELADKYLYDPNAPSRNEELYIPVLEAIISTSILNDVEKERSQYRLKLAMKNRVGTKAVNFTYTLASGKSCTLYSIKSDYLILFFNNPGCHACSQYIQGLSQSKQIIELLKRKKLNILSLYPDESLGEWKAHLNEFPSEWINGYDKTGNIMKKDIYDLKAIPTLYLLDKNKIVLLKDVTIDNLDISIEQILGRKNENQK